MNHYRMKVSKFKEQKNEFVSLGRRKQSLVKIACPESSIGQAVLCRARKKEYFLETESLALETYSLTND